MDPKERELRQALAALLMEARQLTTEGKLEEARSKTDKAQELRKQIDLFEEIRNADQPGETYEQEKEERGDKLDKDTQYRSAFLKSLRGKRLSDEERNLIDSAEEELRAGMSGATDEDGGLLIPKDIQTQIHEYRRQLVSLEQFVTVEPVSTRSGSRVIEKNADITPFVEITELTDLDELDNPKFKPVSFNIKDRGGILPLSNSMLQDSDQNLMQYIAKWIGKKSTVTRNKLILDLAATLTKVAIDGPDKIKEVLNITLDPSIELNTIIITNQDGFNYLDQLKDERGNYLIQPDPTQPTQKLLFGKRVVKLANRWLPTTGTTTKKAPIIIGDLKEAIILFDRQQYSIASTNVGGKSFGRNSTDVRAIEREDVQKLDDGAAVYGELTLTAAAGA